jgi:hypothetical protein
MRIGSVHARSGKWVGSRPNNACREGPMRHRSLLVILMTSLALVATLWATTAQAQRRRPPVRRGAVVFVGLVHVAEGMHHIEIRKRDYRGFSTDVQVRPGETTPLNVSLSAETGE